MKICSFQFRLSPLKLVVIQLQHPSKDIDRLGGALLYETLLCRQTLRERVRFDADVVIELTSI
jgi:hypothetical protein